MAGTYKPGPLNYREDHASKGIHLGGMPGHGRPGHRQQRYNVERNRLREQAQQRRFQDAQNFAQKDAPIPAPLFGPPVKRLKGLKEDPTASRIKKILGNYDDITRSLDNPSMIGVTNQPNTPVTPHPKGKDLFPSNVKKEPKKDVKPENAKEKSREPEVKREKEQEKLAARAPSTQQNGAFQSKEPTSKDERKGVFDQFDKLKRNNAEQEAAGDANRKSRRDSKSAERHKDHSKERSKDRIKVGLGDTESNRPSNKPIPQGTDKRNRDKERQSHERESERMERERQQAELKSSHEKETPNVIASKDIDSGKTQKSVAHPAKNVQSASTPKTSQKSTSSASQNNQKSSQPVSSAGNERWDSDPSLRSSSSTAEVQKSPKTSKPAGGKTTDSKLVQQQDRMMMKPPNGVINGLIKKTQREQGGGESASRHNRPKLKMPNESHGQSNLCVEKILKEMSFDPPLTGIQTPKKDDHSRFPFPTLQKDGYSSKPSNSGDAAACGAAVTKHGASMGGAPEGVSLSKELANDLAISSDSDTEDQGPEQKRRSGASEKPRRSPKPSLNTSKMSDSSESSSSGSESSDTGSDSESSSSDNEDEKEAKEPVVKPPSPAAPPPPQPANPSRSWALKNWKDDMPGAGLPGSEALAAGLHAGGDARTIDKNDALLDMLFQEGFPGPMIDEIMDNKSLEKETSKSDAVSSVKMREKGIFLTIKTKSDAGTPPRSSGRNQSEKAASAGTGMKSPSSAKSVASTKSSVGRSPSRRSRKATKTAPAPTAERERLKSPKPSPQKNNATATATATVKTSPSKQHKEGTVSRQSSSKSGAKSSPRSVKTPPRSAERKSGSSTPKSSQKPQAKSREFLSSSSDSSDEDMDVDVVNVSPPVKVNVDSKQGSTTPRSNKGSRTKGRRGGSSANASSVSAKQESQQSRPVPQPTVALPAPPQHQTPKQDGNLSANSNIDLEDVFNAVIGPSTELTAPGPLLSPIPTPDIAVVRKGVVKTASSPSSSCLSASHVASEAVTAVPPPPPQSSLSSSLSQPPTVAPSSPVSSSESESESSGSESEDSDSSGSGSSRASSRNSSRASSPARTVSSVSVSMVSCTTSTGPSTVSSVSMATAPVETSNPAMRVPGVTYVDGKPSIMVHVDLALLSQLPPMVPASSTAAATTSTLCSLLPPPPPRDVDGAPKKPVAVVEPQQCHVDKAVLDIKMEPGVSSSHLQHGLQPALLLPKDVAALSSAQVATSLTSTSHDSNKDVVFRREADNILANIIKTEDRKPPQTKIPKRKPELDYTKDSHKRARTERRSSSNRNTPSRSTPNRNTPSRSTPKRSTDDISERERTSHEDDHEWDRKHPQRSHGSEERERRGGSCSSSSSHHSELERDRSHDRNRDSKRAKYERDREHRDREKERKRERERERSRDKTELRDMRMDWDAPNSVEESHTLDGQTFNGNHPAANHWSSVAAGLDPSVDHSSDQPPNRRHEWRRKEHTEKIESADHYLNEACRLKHQADTLMDRLAKSLMYVEAVLSFIQCGNAMEHERISEPNKIFTMYKDTYTLIRHIYKFRGSHDGEVHDKEKKLSVLSLRIQSLLCLKLYKLKKNETSKFKRVIDDHNKSASQQKAQAPSPYQTNWNRSTGTPSPMSPTPSPAGSVGSVGSVLSPQGSGNGDHRLTNGSLTAGSSMSSPSTVSLPQRIHQITLNYVSHVYSLVQCHDLWEQADGQANEFTEFFQELDYEAGCLTLHSSILDLVRYVRTGLHRLNDT